MDRFSDGLKMVRITPLDVAANRSNAGSQPKWRIGDIWYKMDDSNYEGLAETVVSELLERSNLQPYAAYEPVWIKYKGKLRRGCRSRDFLPDRTELLESTELLTMHGLADAARDESDSAREPEKSVHGFVDAMKQITGLGAFEVYLAKMLELDMIVLNADRHFGNITVLRTPSGYQYAPMFDHGRSLALRDDLWKSGKTAEEVIDSIEARPFSRIFVRQVRIAEALAGGPRFWTSYGMDSLRQTLDRCSTVYPDRILRRAEKVFGIQLQRNIDHFREEGSRKLLERYLERISGNIEDSFRCGIEEGELRVRTDRKSGAYLRVNPSGRIDVMEGERTLSVDETVARHRDLIPLYRKITEIMD